MLWNLCPENEVRLSEGLYYQYEDQYEDVETAEEMGTPADCTFLYGMTKEQGEAYQPISGIRFMLFIIEAEWRI